MLIIRSALMSDLEQLVEISNATGSGMSSMPSNEASWIAKLSNSEESIKSQTYGATGEVYFLVMEDTSNGKIVGTSAIYAGVGLSQPFYSYKVSKLVSFSEDIDVKLTMKVLHLVNDYTGTTEIGSLFLDADYRKNGNGQFLSRCRYLMMADFADRFSDTVIAEMRGWQDENGNSPVWENLGRKFFGLGFENADYMSAVKGNQFITNLMPKHPIYVDLLSEETQKAIGVPHPASAPALRLLEKEGFKHTGYVDIFDGGPTVQCDRSHIRSLSESRLAKVVSVHEKLNPNALADMPYIISNGNIDQYRIVLQPLEQNSDGEISINPQTAEALGIGTGDSVRFIQLTGK